MGKREGSAAKQALVVVGGLAFVWLAIEIALKPFLQQTRAAIDKSDPNRDPDDDASHPAADDASTPAADDASPPAADAASTPAADAASTAAADTA
ncbi:outer envelope membrane protein 7 [Prosopis cineraria]|uniref:outer envelope membrane protein 7 n=1 Tax=Prosopis cineraria TaxID=364024 RepID=UPI00240F81E7|nr:outer envelope membrane protein 7 [Prosopis cineraria]